MQQLLDHLSTNFQNYNDSVTKFLNAATKNWDALFSETDFIRRCIFHVTREFLNSDDQQLFIQFPTDKLGRADSKQRDNLKSIQDILTDILFLATKNSWEPKLNCPNINSTNTGDFYYSNGKVWEIKRGVHGNNIPKYPTKGICPANTALKTFADNINFGIKLNNVSNSTIQQGVILNNGNQVTEMRLRGLSDRINLYRSLKNIGNAGSCIIIGNTPHWDSHPANCGCIDSPITFASKYENLKETSCDILVLLWDRKYKLYETEIHNLVVTGEVKKVIYIGTEIFDNFQTDKRKRNTWFSFTFRELFTSYYRTFPKINFPKVNFPQHLTTAISQLQQVIPQTISQNDSKKILRYALYPYMGIDIPQTQPDTQLLYDFLYDNFLILSVNNINNIVNIATNIYSSNHPCPKRHLLNGLCNTFVINPTNSYKKRLNQSLTEKNNCKNNYIIDAYFDGKFTVDAIRTLFEKGAMGKYHILSYVALPILKRFFEVELDTYNEDERKRYLNNITFPNIAVTQSSQNLLDFLDSSLDDVSRIFPSKTTQQTSYTCTFNNSNNVDVYGDVIVNKEIISIDEIYDGKNDYLPCDITYYTSPSNFQNLMELYFNFPSGRTVNYFSNLWKTEMRNLYINKYNKDINAMSADFPFLKKQKLRDIVNNRYTPQFPEEISQITTKLLNLGSIDQRDANYIRAANIVVGQHSSKAKELKASLFNYYITGNTDTFLSQILNNAQTRRETLSASDIVKNSLKTATLTDITKNN